jgi:hypothetical protein
LSTAYIYNGFGQYEEKDGKQGITLGYAGIEFFLPYKEVTVIPNFMLREVDHDKSTPQGDVAGELEYMSIMVPGERIAEELLMKQVPIRNRDMGIINIKGKATGKAIQAFAGWSTEGQVITQEVLEKEPTPTEIFEAEDLCKRYKETMIQDYFQSKRERMTGGKGRLHPDPRTRTFMEELGIEDLDDVTAHAQKQNGLTAEEVAKLIEQVQSGEKLNGAALLAAIETVRKTGKAQLTSRKRSIIKKEEKKEEVNV